MQTYSNPERESDPHALPDVEVFYVTPREAKVNFVCGDTMPTESGWYYWYCFPGCLPDSDPIGPFATAAEAESAAQEDAE
jgi:hypothetical protein